MNRLCTSAPREHSDLLVPRKSSSRPLPTVPASTSTLAMKMKTIRKAGRSGAPTRRSGPAVCMLLSSNGGAVLV